MQSRSPARGALCEPGLMSDEGSLRAYYEAEAVAGARARMGSRGRRDVLREAFVAQLAREQRARVVEVGAGPGTDADVFVEAGLEHVGFDLSVGNARLARDADRTVIAGSLFAPPFRERSFDAGWTMSTLMHVPDDRFDAAMEATVSLLRLAAPLAIGLWGGIDREFTNETDHFDPPRFFSLRSDERVRTMLAPHGAIESFETWPNDRNDWCYQFIILRV